MVSGDNNMIGDSTVVIDRKIDLNFFIGNYYWKNF